MLHAERLDLKSDNANTVAIGILVVEDSESQMVEEEDLGRLCQLLLGDFLALLVHRRVDESQGVTGLVRLDGLAFIW